MYLALCSGRVLEDSQSLSAAGVQDGHTLHLVEQDPAVQQQQQQPAGGPGGDMGADALLRALMGGAATPGGVEVGCVLVLWALPGRF